MKGLIFLVLLATLVAGALAQTCTLCGDAAETPNLTNPTPRFQSSTVTCVSLDGQRASFNANDDGCKNIQLSAYQIGCCATPPVGYCTTCPDGTSFNMQAKIPEGSPSGIACGIYPSFPGSHFPLNTIGDCSNTYLQRSSHFCGCQGVERQCGICPENNGVEYPPVGTKQRKDNFINKRTCEVMDFFASLYKSNECADAKRSFGVDYAKFCMCPGYTAEDGTCTVCDDGQSQEPGDTVIKEEGGVTLTCADADLLARAIITDAACDELKDIAQGKCCKSSAETFKRGAYLLFLAVGVAGSFFL